MTTNKIAHSCDFIFWNTIAYTVGTTMYCKVNGSIISLVCMTKFQVDLHTRYYAFGRKLLASFLRFKHWLQKAGVRYLTLFTHSLTFGQIYWIHIPSDGITSAIRNLFSPRASFDDFVSETFYLVIISA